MIHRLMLAGLVALAGGSSIAGPARVLTLPDGSVSDRATGLATERRIAVSGSRLLALRGTVPAGFVARLEAAYRRLQADRGELPSALLASQLNLQSPDAFDTLVVEPPSGVQPRAGHAVVFLHGYAGNIGLICWTVARAAGRHGLTTYCPSIGFEGDWWRARGARTLAATLRFLRGRGVRRVFLVGLSNGARGASLLAPRFRRRLAGLVLISGLSGRAASPGVPVLLVHGRADPAVPAAAARTYVRRAAARQVVVPGDHFVLLTREARVQAAITRWLGQRLR